MDCPLPSSYWGTPIYGNLHIIPYLRYMLFFFPGFFGWFWCSSIFKVSQQQCRIWRVQCWRDCGWSSSLRLSAREEAVVRCHAVSTAANDSSTMSVWQRSDGAAFGPRLCVWVALELNDWTLMCFAHFNGLICHTLGIFGATYFVGAISIRILCFKFHMKSPLLAWVHTSWFYIYDHLWRSCFGGSVKSLGLSGVLLYEQIIQSEDETHPRGAKVHWNSGMWIRRPEFAIHLQEQRRLVRHSWIPDLRPNIPGSDVHHILRYSIVYSFVLFCALLLAFAFWVALTSQHQQTDRVQ